MPANDQVICTFCSFLGLLAVLTCMEMTHGSRQCCSGIFCRNCHLWGLVKELKPGDSTLLQVAFLNKNYPSFLWKKIICLLVYKYLMKTQCVIFWQFAGLNNCKSPFSDLGRMLCACRCRNPWSAASLLFQLGMAFIGNPSTGPANLWCPSCDLPSSEPASQCGPVRNPESWAQPACQSSKLETANRSPFSSELGVDQPTRSLLPSELDSTNVFLSSELDPANQSPLSSTKDYTYCHLENTFSSWKWQSLTLKELIIKL